MAIVFTAVLLASAIIGVQGGHILNTQEEGTGPITASLNTETLKEGNNVVVDDAAIATQGQAGGPRTVKEFSRDEEFSMFALSWEGKKDVAAFVRAQKDDGSWSDWVLGPTQHWVEVRRSSQVCRRGYLVHIHRES